jgi:hypothetical protein
VKRSRAQLPPRPSPRTHICVGGVVVPSNGLSIIVASPPPASKTTRSGSAMAAAGRPMPRLPFPHAPACESPSLVLDN